MTLGIVAPGPLFNSRPPNSRSVDVSRRGMRHVEGQRQRQRRQVSLLRSDHVLRVYRQDARANGHVAGSGLIIL